MYDERCLCRKKNKKKKKKDGEVGPVALVSFRQHPTYLCNIATFVSRS